MIDATDRVKLMLEEGSVDKETMIYINSDRAFRCEVCGANVFKKIGKYHFKCNGCEACYRGEPK